MRSLLQAALVALLAGCGSGADDQVQASVAAQNLTQAEVVQADSLDRLIEQLADVGGAFERVGAGHDLRFEGSLDVVRALSAFEDSAVVALVDCMDREEPTQTTLDGQRLPLGSLCFDALRRIAHYEATDSLGDIDGSWAGYITVDAPRAERVRAKEAWAEVVRRRAYGLP